MSWSFETGVPFSGSMLRFIDTLQRHENTSGAILIAFRLAHENVLL
jgi:hypothetical protein